MCIPPLSLKGSLRHRGMRYVVFPSQFSACTSQWNTFRGLISRFPVFFGFVAGTTFFFISSSCLATLLLPMAYWAKRPGLEDHSPVRSDFSPKRESKSPGPPKPRSRVRYGDGEKQLRRQRQYTAGVSDRAGADQASQVVEVW